MCGVTHLSTHKNTSSGTLLASEDRRHDILAIASLAATALLTLSLLSYDPSNATTNLVGFAGHRIAGWLIVSFGLIAWVLPIEAILLTQRLFRRKTTTLGVATLASTLMLVLTGAAMMHLLVAPKAMWDVQAGGAVGELIGEVSRSLLGLAGSFVVGFSIIASSIILRIPWSVAHTWSIATKLSHHQWARTKELTSTLQTTFKTAWKEARPFDDIHEQSWESNPLPILTPEQELEDSELQDNNPRSDTIEDEPNICGQHQSDRTEAPENSAHTNLNPTIVAPQPSKQLMGEPERKTQRGTFQLPPTSLLESRPSSQIQVETSILRKNAEQLTEKLAAYGVHGRVDEIHPGPVVTMYEFEPQSGTKVSKIAGLADDLAMALAAQKVRIVAPIAGKARVGFELPNENRQLVYFREILEDRRWQQHGGDLPIALGKDIAGQPVYSDLTKMPHLLVAGATGAGKSVGLNVMLASILTKKTPEEVRMLMIDPKVVELQVFDGIPHMLLPVVTDMKKAALALRWAVDEMERRYQLFADAGARNISTYNQRVERVLRGKLLPSQLTPKRKSKGQNDQPALSAPFEDHASDEQEVAPDKLPSIVVVVDEFADLMMVAAKDVESCIARLAQKARAAGIHVILATPTSKRGCDHRHDQSKLPSAYRIQGLSTTRLDDDPRKARR